MASERYGSGCQQGLGGRGAVGPSGLYGAAFAGDGKGRGEDLCSQLRLEVIKIWVGNPPLVSEDLSPWGAKVQGLPKSYPIVLGCRSS